MRKRAYAVMAFTATLLLLMGVSAFAKMGDQTQSAVGTWKLDAKKSSYGNMPAPKFEQLVVMEDKPDSLKWNLKGATVDGKTYISSYDGPIDGKDHPLLSNEAASTVAYTRTASGVQWVTKNKSGAVIETGSSQLSPDGHMLTLKGTAQGPNGKVNFTSVFGRAH